MKPCCLCWEMGGLIIKRSSNNFKSFLNPRNLLHTQCDAVHKPWQDSIPDGVKDIRWLIIVIAIWITASVADPQCKLGSVQILTLFLLMLDYFTYICAFQSRQPVCFFRKLNNFFQLVTKKKIKIKWKIVSWTLDFGTLNYVSLSYNFTQYARRRMLSRQSRPSVSVFLKLYLITLVNNYVTKEERWGKGEKRL